MRQLLCIHIFDQLRSQLTVHLQVYSVSRHCIMSVAFYFNPIWQARPACEGRLASMSMFGINNHQLKFPVIC